MAIYTAKLTIPANTPRDSPVSVTVELERAVITRIIIRIPSGHLVLTGMRICYGDMQLWPEESGTWITGENEVIDWTEYFELPDDPTRLRLEGYNEDDTYDHAFLIRICTLPRAIAAPWLAVSKFVQIFSRLLGLR